MKELFKVNEKYNSGVLEINQIMSKLLTLSKRFQLNTRKLEQLFARVSRKLPRGKSPVGQGQDLV